MKLRINEKLVKRAVTFALVGTIVTTLAGCGNKQIFDTQYTFNKAVIVNGDVATIVELEKWTDYEDGEQIQVKTKDGLVFLANSDNIYPIDERNTDITPEEFARALVGEKGEVNYLGTTAKTK